MSKSPTPFDDLNGSGHDVPLSKNTQPLPSRPGSLLSNLQSGRTLPPDPDPFAATPTPTSVAPNPSPVAPTPPPVVTATPSASRQASGQTSRQTTGRLGGPFQRVPLPTLIGGAMAAGALAVVLIPALMRRVIPSAPIRTLPDSTLSAPDDSVPMIAPDDNLAAAPENAVDAAKPQIKPQVSPGVAPQTVPTVAPSPLATAPRTEVQPSASTSERYASTRYEIEPPAGWKRVRSGRRTEWKGPNEAQLVVETTAQTGASPRGDWEDLERRLSKKYGSRFRSMGIREGNLAGQNAAIWEFEIEGKDGRVTRKIDVAIHHKGRGYAVLGAAPSENFESLRPQIEGAINSFQLNANQSEPPESPRETRRETNRESSRDSNRDSAIPIPEDETPARDDATPEQGY